MMPGQTRENVVLIGAGSVSFMRGLVGDLIRRGWEVELRLVDIDPDALAMAEALARKMIEETQAPICLCASTDRREVLPGASVVITTIAVGGRDAWQRDMDVSRKHGVYQPIGDTCGPAGTSRALRMIPAMIDIANDIADLAPDSRFFNYANPMAANCRAVNKATDVPVIGLCHGVKNVARHLAYALEVPFDQLGYTAVGINHLTWFVGLRHGDRDLMGRLGELAREMTAGGYRTAPPSFKGQTDTGLTDEEGKKIWDQPVTWHLADLFGALPSAMDRHVVEFFGHWFTNGDYYGQQMSTEIFNFEKRIQNKQETFEWMRDIALSKEPLGEAYFDKLAGEHEEVCDILQSHHTDDNQLYSVNLPNTGQVPNLPPEAIIESPGMVQCGRLRPINQDPLPPALAGTLASRYMWLEATVDAALEGSRDKLAQALALDPAVDSPAKAQRLATDIIDAQAEYLPQFVDYLSSG